PFHYDLYNSTPDAQGNFDLVASGNPVASLNGQAVVTLPAGVTGGNAYFLRVGWLVVPSAKLNVTASTSLSKDAGPMPGTELNFNLPNPASRVDEAPDGSFSANSKGDLPVSAALALQGAQIFYVGSGGVADLNVTLQSSDPQHPDLNPTIALYRGMVTSGENPVEVLHLVDFVNDHTFTDDVHYELQDYLDPGMYVLSVVRDASKPAATQLAVAGSLPAFPVQEIVLNPSTGKNLGALRAAETVPDSLNEAGGSNQSALTILEQYRTDVYHVITPGGSLGNLMVNASHPEDDKQNTLEGWGGSNGSADLNVWDQPSPGTYAQVPTAVHQQLIPPGQDPMTNEGEPDTQATAQPGSDCVISLTRDNLFGKTAVTTRFEVPQSGTPDLVVEPIQLLADGGQTRVEVTVVNKGTASSNDTTAWVEFTDASKPPGQQ